MTHFEFDMSSKPEIRFVMESGSFYALASLGKVGKKQMVWRTYHFYDIPKEDFYWSESNLLTLHFSPNILGWGVHFLFSIHGGTKIHPLILKGFKRVWESDLPYTEQYPKHPKEIEVLESINRA